MAAIGLSAKFAYSVYFLMLNAIMNMFEKLFTEGNENAMSLILLEQMRPQIREQLNSIIELRDSL